MNHCQYDKIQEKHMMNAFKSEMDCRNRKTIVERENRQWVQEGEREKWIRKSRFEMMDDRIEELQIS